MNRIAANTIRRILEILVEKDYYCLYKLDSQKQLSAQLIENAILEYGGQVTMPPIPFPLIDIYRQPEQPNALFADVRLWIDNEESDLTLQCTLFSNKVHEGQYAFAITDILVM